MKCFGGEVCPSFSSALRMPHSFSAALGRAVSSCFRFRMSANTLRSTAFQPSSRISLPLAVNSSPAHSVVSRVSRYRKGLLTAISVRAMMSFRTFCSPLGSASRSACSILRVGRMAWWSVTFSRLTVRRVRGTASSTSSGVMSKNPSSASVSSSSISSSSSVI